MDFKKTEGVQRYNATSHKAVIKENTTLPYLGNNYPLVINKKQHTKDSMDLVDSKFVVTVRASRLTSKLLQKYMRIG